MKLYLFTWDTAYGEFVCLLSAKDGKEAQKLFRTKHKWAKGKYKLEYQEICTPDKAEIIFNGGGSSG